MGGGFRKEVAAVGPIVTGFSGDVLVGGILIYMGLCSLERGGGRDDDYKHENDDDRYHLRGTFTGRVVVGPDAKFWNKVKGGNSDNHDNCNDHDNDDDDSTIPTKNQSNREIM